MKITALILTLLVFGLSVEPVSGNCMGRSTVKQDNCCCKHNKTENVPNNTGHQCNPFVICASCCGFCAPQYSCKTSTANTSETLLPPVISVNIPGYICDCFHPPKTA